MDVNAKMRPVETTPGIREKCDKVNDEGGEFNDTL
jgi:hypothetical protein